MLTRRRCMNAFASAMFMTGLGGVRTTQLLAEDPPVKDDRTSRFRPDVEIELNAIPDELALFKGEKTPVWRFHGKVVAGRKGALTPGDSYLGPTIRLVRKERVRIHFSGSARADDGGIGWFLPRLLEMLPIPRLGARTACGQSVAGTDPHVAGS